METNDQKQEQKQEDYNPTHQEMIDTLKRAEEKRLEALRGFYRNTARIYREMSDRH